MIARTILVTGSSGFIGSRLVARLSADPGWRLICLMRSPRPVTAGTEVLSSLEDLTEAIWQGIGQIDVVVHLAGFIPKAAGQGDDSEAAYRDNIKGTHALLNSLSRPTRVVFASSIDVHGPPLQSHLDESSPLNAQNSYAVSKVFGERLVAYHCANRGGASAILRFGHIFGPGEGAYQKLIPHTIRTLLAGQAPTIFGDGAAKRDLLFVDDAVEAIVRAISSEQDLGPVLVARGESTTVLEVVRLLMELTGTSVEPEFHPMGGMESSITIDTRRMRSVLGQWPLTSLRDGLAREVEWFRTELAND